jgi:hypothetical protein
MQYLVAGNQIDAACLRRRKWHYSTKLLRRRPLAVGSDANGRRARLTRWQPSAQPRQRTHRRARTRGRWASLGRQVRCRAVGHRHAVGQKKSSAQLRRDSSSSNGVQDLR